MEKRLFCSDLQEICRIFMFLLSMGIFLNGYANTLERKVLFDDDWSFYLGTACNSISSVYDDSSWEKVDLPHDWSVEPLRKSQTDEGIIGPFSRQSVGGFAIGHTVGGEGWYRKTFVITPEDEGKRHELYFEGVYNQSEVWVNEKKVYYNVYGYTSFRVDITPYCKPAGQINTIVVKVLNEGKNSRWYTGSGIYRHVWLIRTAHAYIEDWGTFIRTTSLTKNSANVALSTSVVNGERTGRYVVEVVLFSPENRIVSEKKKVIHIAWGDTLVTDFNLKVGHPQLWSVDTPILYTACVRLKQGREIKDEYSFLFGIRTLKFSVEEGFELNGVKMKLQGGCVHHDNGLLGSKAFDRAEERKIELLKANGFNAIRTSHNPMSEALLSACDRLGMLVVNEAFDQWSEKKNPQDYHLYFNEWSARDIETLIRRDRNHPSVIMWSIGNEIRERASEKGMEIARCLKNEVLKYDTTRPVTAGINKQWDKKHKQMLSLEKAYRHLDVVGHNYMWKFYENIHKEYPSQIMYGSESVATEAAQNWDKVEKYPFVLGDFIWTAMDYLGESGLGNSLEIDPQENVHQFMDWPWFNAWCGDLDLLGIKKPQSYYRDILWRQRDITMAVETPIVEGKVRKVSFWGWPEESLSWTFPGMEGKEMTVNVYTRAHRVRLYLNDKLVGEEEVSELYKASFKVPYRPGTLKAVVVNEGKEGKSVMLETTCKPMALRLVADRSVIEAGGQDLSYILIEQVDKDGHIVYSSGQKIKLTSKGDSGSIIASGTACPNDMSSFQSLTPVLFNGRAMVVVRSGKKNGELNIGVAAEGLKGDSIIIKSN